MPSPSFAKRSPLNIISGKIRLLMKSTFACAVVFGLAVCVLAACKEAVPLTVDNEERAYSKGVVAYNAYEDEKALHWFTRAAEEGDAAGQFILGMMYMLGEGGSKDIAEGTRWLKLAADQGDAEAQLWVGMIAMLKDDSGADEVDAGRGLLEGATSIRLAADKGFGPAQEMLGEMYLSMNNTASEADWLAEIPAELRQDLTNVFPKDRDDAIRLLMVAADQGHAGGIGRLGDKYRFGIGVKEDPVEAVRWYRLSAEKGSATGQVSLGDMYHHGEGVPKSDGEAVRWYNLAVDQGNADAQFKLGGMYLKGTGVPKDGPEAIRLYTLAADQGHSFALFDLARIYRSGEGVPKNDVLAYKWFNILAALHDDEISRRAREELGRKMTPAQIAEAQRLSSEWKVSTPRVLSQYLRNVPAE